MADIGVDRVAGDTFRVIVSGGGSPTSHTVTADADTIGRIGGGVDAEAVIEASFRFLLDREPKEAIMSAFELSVIARFFPDYPDAIQEYLP